MAGSKFNYLELKALDWILGAFSFSVPSTLYLALFTTAPTSAGGGVEVSTTSTAYARVAITNNSTNWPAASGGGPGTKANGAAFTFPTATAAWGTIVAWGLFDAASAGNGIYFGTLNTSRAVNLGDTPSFAIGALTITET
jgi:hypothetical protein